MTLSFIKTLCFIDLHLEANYCHLNRFNVENHTTKGTITMSYVIALSAVTTEQEYLANKKRVHLSLLCLTADLCSTKTLEETMSTHAHLVIPGNLSPDLT